MQSGQLTPLVEAIAGRCVVQIGLVVRDLGVALERYAAVLGEGPWWCYTLTAAMHATAEYRGDPTDFSVRLAFNDRSPHWELIQPLTGRSITVDSHASRLRRKLVAAGAPSDPIVNEWGRNAQMLPNQAI